jgi:tryptophan halogenase
MESLKPRNANAFKISIEAGEVVFDFGAVMEPTSTGGAAGVSVTDRVTMPLETSRRLSYWLNETLAPLAAALRAEEAKGLPPSQAAIAARPGQTPMRPAADEAGERAAQLLRLVGNLGIPHQYERSFRICERALLANRFLLTLNAGDIPGDPCGRTLEICDQLRMPSPMRGAAAENFAMAKCVHFGFEADGDAIICKLYLERAVTPEEAQCARQGEQPVLLHIAFKWDLARDAAVTTKYFWRPGLSTDQIEARLAQLYRNGPQASFTIAKAVLDLTRGRVAPEQMQYLEVEEADNARRSFDLNLYNTHLQVKDMQDVLHQMREHFGVRPGQVQALYDQIKTKTLGHLAGGVHRDGKDFFNVYYGVVGLPHFHEAFRQAEGAAGVAPGGVA